MAGKSAPKQAGGFGGGGGGYGGAAAAAARAAAARLLLLPPTPGEPLGRAAESAAAWVSAVVRPLVLTWRDSGAGGDASAAAAAAAGVQRAAQPPGLRPRPLALPRPPPAPAPLGAAWYRLFGAAAAALFAGRCRGCRRPFCGGSDAGRPHLTLLGGVTLCPGCAERRHPTATAADALARIAADCGADGPRADAAAAALRRAAGGGCARLDRTYRAARKPRRVGGAAGARYLAASVDAALWVTRREAPWRPPQADAADAEMCRF